MTDERALAVTSFIPYPRLGGSKEAERAKHYPENKISLDAAFKTIGAVRELESERKRLVAGKDATYPVALHEVRKYNRTIKQEAERLCEEESPGAPYCKEAYDVAKTKQKTDQETQCPTLLLVPG